MDMRYTKDCCNVLLAKNRLLNRLANWLKVRMEPLGRDRYHSQAGVALLGGTSSSASSRLVAKSQVLVLRDLINKSGGSNVLGRWSKPPAWGRIVVVWGLRVHPLMTDGLMEDPLLVGGLR
ncbi:hypothetical protein PVK06_003374 [Gossypium arboreum]|uniref:Uncharacterized protein n=1 Tax=Gossypium arboreum TaxID=29729 RepID=A0ABR0R7C5_GOSAR|nr:hypothetical protein PVK06_003374 [Gossypium arboreum]